MSVKNSSEQPPIRSGSPVLETHQVDESWALRLLEECEQEDFISINIQSQASNDISAIQNQMINFAIRQDNEENNTTKANKPSQQVKAVIMKILPVFTIN